jgi:hypothetical protein
LRSTIYALSFSNFSSFPDVQLHIEDAFLAPGMTMQKIWPRVTPNCKID